MVGEPIPAPEATEEQRFLTLSWIGAQQCVKPLVISWAIGLGGILIGRSATDPFLSLLFPVGMVGTFAAVIITIFALWTAAPVLVGRTPESFRALSALGFVLLWTSVPLWIHYFVHEQVVSASGLLDYFEYRGLFVAKLFIVGILAFAVGRQLDFEPHRKIQPYVLIPIVGALLGGWLTPEEDRAAWRTGLTLGLVYYLGVTLAICVGFYFGQIARDRAKVP